VRTPRKRFILIGTGIGLAIVLAFGLLTSIGKGSNSANGNGSAPSVGGPVPSFSATNIGPKGTTTVSVGGAASGKEATVLLFFGNWCPSCHQELPPLAAAVRAQDAAGGPLSHIRVVGVDSEDKVGNAKSFIASSGVRFPVAYDPNVTILSGDFFFVGDPNAVFIKANGKIGRIVNGDGLTAASFASDEQALLK
jgi:peroxiredoxin